MSPGEKDYEKEDSVDHDSDTNNGSDLWRAKERVTEKKKRKNVFTKDKGEHSKLCWHTPR